MTRPAVRPSSVRGFVGIMGVLAVAWVVYLGCSDYEAETQTPAGSWVEVGE